jgi:hypothetical protein
VPASNGRQHVRVALHRGQPGQARLAISALHAIPRVKHVFVVDDDVDVFSDEQMEWAMSARFRAASDIVVSTGHPAFYMDPSADAKGSMDKPARLHRPLRHSRYSRDAPPARRDSTRAVLSAKDAGLGPMFFTRSWRRSAARTARGRARAACLAGAGRAEAAARRRMGVEGAVGKGSGHAQAVAAARCARLPAAAGCQAQDFPSRAIRIIVPNPPGGAGDIGAADPN